MKEFQYKTGGRRLYNEDIARLQELALSMTSIFTDCELNFVVSGCKVTINQNVDSALKRDIVVTPGFVWINGKLRELAGATYKSAPASYVPAIKIKDVINDSQIKYADGSSGPGYYDYTAELVVGTNEDFSEDYIVYNTEAKKFPDMATFFEHYCVLNTDKDWKEIKGKALTKDGGQLADSAYLKLTHGRTEDGDETFAEIRPHKISMQQDDNSMLTEIDGLGIRTTGDIKASSVECDHLIVRDEIEDSNGGSVVIIHRFKTSDIIDKMAKYDATMTKIDGMETLLHAFENKLKATTEIAEEAQKTGIDLEEKIRNQMEPQQAGTTPVT